MTNAEAQAAQPHAIPSASGGAAYWRRNLYVCLFGSFTTLVAMTLLLPFLPLYVAQLGVETQAGVVQWSGIAFGITFLGAGVMAPIWGKFADRYGRKLILMRASFCMAVMMAAMGLVQDVWQLVALRLLVGLLGGYASGAVVLIATQTPKDRVGWALGTLSTGTLAGSLLGPLIGGALPSLIGLRTTFFLSGAVIFVAFLATCLLIREDVRVVAPKRDPLKREGGDRGGARRGAWSMIPDRRPVLAMLGTATLLTLANMSIEPIITVYVGQLAPGQNVALIAGFVMAASALGSVLAAPRLGRLADRFGAWNVIIGCLAVSAALLIPQAVVTNAWQLVALRFLMGMSLAGLLPSINALIRHSVPDAVTGTMLGYAVSAQYAGQVVGPVVGGFVGGHFGMRPVFLATMVLMVVGALFNWTMKGRVAAS
ncbi:MAG TPA: MFS transporter [Stellaceae bacterium]|nr:MFS transporter [Stellaceae bacterium]